MTLVIDKQPGMYTAFQTYTMRCIAKFYSAFFLERMSTGLIHHGSTAYLMIPPAKIGTSRQLGESDVDRRQGLV